MNREQFLGALAALAGLPLAGCAAPTDVGPTAELDDAPAEVTKTATEWRALLSAEAFAVLFEEWTEAPGSSSLLNEHRPGTYLCAACLIPLFQSVFKYESGTGWPTFST